MKTMTLKKNRSGDRLGDKSGDSHGDRHGKLSGFSLIEVLITLLILAVGLLGVAALQYRGLQFSHDAYLRSQVNILAYDIADRIRLNRANAAKYADAVTDETITTRPGCTLTGAGSAKNVTNDINCWKQQFFDALPPGSLADISITDPDEQIFRVQLSWIDRDLTRHDVDYSFRP